jgi:hypothetical protein
MERGGGGLQGSNLGGSYGRALLIPVTTLCTYFTSFAHPLAPYRLHRQLGRDHFTRHRLGSTLLGSSKNSRPRSPSHRFPRKYR